MEHLRTLEWVGEGLRLVDQTKLPTELVYETIDTCEGVHDAIRCLMVRGAPAIGDAAAFGVYLGVRAFPEDGDRGRFAARVKETVDYLAGSRPTAVNLFWALRRMHGRADRELEAGRAIADVKRILLAEAEEIRREDIDTCRRIGENGFEVLRDYGTLLTHCNAGGLATAEYGTALAPVYVGLERGKVFNVYADETRPLLQGSRITAFELQQAGVPVTVICDNMAASVMAKGLVDAVIVGADRIAGNGDTANKIGTYGLALVAKAHRIPFYVAAPLSTFDLDLPSGDGIPIEERSDTEVTQGFGRRTAPEGISVFNPAFDVTPAELITAIVTERGVIESPSAQRVAAVVK